MKIVQTYYSYADNKNPIYDTAGFLTADMNWKSMAVSCLLLKNITEASPYIATVV